MTTEEKIIELIREKSGAKNISPETDIHEDLGVAGDDFHELMEEYQKQFGVDMSNYLWYFHADEEGQNIGGFFFKPPHARVTRISVTPKMMSEFANSGIWRIEYPEHKIPRYRLDTAINFALTVAAVILVLWYYLG